MYKTRTRIELIDFVRGIAVLIIIIYHFLYNLAVFGIITWEQMFSTPLNIIQALTASTFVFLAGFSSNFSRNNIKRGLQTFAFGVAVAFFSSFADITIRFGVLHLLGSSMILYGLIGDKIKKLPNFVVPLICIPLFFTTYYMYRNVFFEIEFLYPLGIRSANFTSADYFPLMPWFFLFLLGSWAGGNILKNGEKPWMERKYPKFFVTIGRKTLIIYLVHQIVLYPLAMGIDILLSL